MKNLKIKRVYFIYMLLTCLSFNLWAQIPAGYYDDANGKTGYTLKSSLYNIIKGHTDKGYGALWTLYETSDDKPNGKVWDMYSDVPGGTPAYEYTFGSDQCGNYSGEGSCYNREHSFPKSWFNDASPMNNDPFHIVPSDGYVNGKRGNYAFGEVGSATWVSTNGSKVGASNYPGYSETVFEPIDAYKGDFARGYFYMATRYENVIAGWENNNDNGDAMLDGTSDQVYEDWALEMLLAWHNADPVSQKEIDRNDAIYDFQGNRNPFIDHPEYVASIWGGASSSTITVTSTMSNFGAVQFGEVSNTQSYTVLGTDLTSNISITSSSEFEISLADVHQDFTNNLVLNHSSGVVANTTIYVRFKPASDSNSAISGIISHTSSGATMQELTVNGTEYFMVVPQINFSFSERNISSDESYQVQLYADIAPNDDLIVHIEKVGGTYNATYSTTPPMENDRIELMWASGNFNAFFTIDFDTHNAGNLLFLISENEKYTIGSNNEFKLNINEEDIISAIDKIDQRNFLVYPNPASHTIQLGWGKQYFSYAIIDTMGQIVKKGEASGTVRVNVAALKKGQYIVQATNKENLLLKKIAIY